MSAELGWEINFRRETNYIYSHRGSNWDSRSFKIFRVKGLTTLIEMSHLTHNNKMYHVCHILSPASTDRYILPADVLGL